VDNTATGYSALSENIQGDRNTANGKNALFNTRGHGNIGFGYRAGDNILYGDNNIMIGYAIEAPSANGDGQLNIGNLIYGTGVDGTGSTVSSGKIGIGVKTPTHKLHLVSYHASDDAVFVDILEGAGEDLIIDDQNTDITIRPTADGEGYLGSTTYTWAVLNAVTKNFSISHPIKQGWELKHSVLEGPEIAVFYRGEGQLINGTVEIDLPDYFEKLTIDGNRTVLLTPIAETGIPISNLASTYVVDGKFSVVMIGNANPSQKFFWEVKAVRADVPLLDVEIEDTRDYDNTIDDVVEKHQAGYYDYPIRERD
jgi:hypothetical protein